MSDNNDKAEEFENRVKNFTLSWIAFSFVIGAMYMPDNADWSDIGALLSGIFAPIAWAWFYASYKVQSSELQLQREELKLQRQAIEQSTIAQQGSEQALKEQSEALRAQLAITQKQFEIQQKEIEDNKPRYGLASSLEQILHSGKTEENFYLSFYIHNTRGKAEITDVAFEKLSESFHEKLMRYLVDNFEFEINYISEKNRIEIYSKSSKYHITKHLLDNNLITPNKSGSTISKTEDMILAGLLDGLQFRIYYDSVRTGMNSDVYKFIIHNDKDIELVREVSNTYHFN